MSLLQKILSLLHDRELFYDSTADFLPKNLLLENKKIYLGIDPTADCIHMGHLAGLAVLRAFSQHGIKCIILIGDFTAKIGDPSLKTKARKQLSEENVEENMKTLIIGIERIARAMGINFTILRNSSWLKQRTLGDHIDFVSSFNVREMMRSRMFKNRMESDNPLYLNEMMYCTVQAYDFYYLHKNHDCVMQIGGQDQWNNMLLGQDAIKKAGGCSAILTYPLVVDKNGNKIGKTENSSLPLCFERNSLFYTWVSTYNIDDVVAQKICKIFGINAISLQDLKAMLSDYICKIGYSTSDNSLATIREIARRVAHGEDIDPSILISIQNLLINISEPSFKHLLRCCKSVSSLEIQEALSGGIIKINNKKIISIQDFYASIQKGINIVSLGRYFYVFTH